MAHWPLIEPRAGARASVAHLERCNYETTPDTIVGAVGLDGLRGITDSSESLYKGSLGRLSHGHTW